MMTDFRALCAELADAYLRTLEHINNSTWLGYEPSDDPLLLRARAALADEPVVPAELLQRQALVPVPDAERPWEREGWCDELGRCWWGRPDTGDWSADWTLATPEAIAEFCEFSPQTVCLPAHALPLPEVGE